MVKQEKIGHMEKKDLKDAYSRSRIISNSFRAFPLHPLYKDVNKKRREGYIQGQMEIIRELQVMGIIPDDFIMINPGTMDVDPSITVAQLADRMKREAKGLSNHEMEALRKMDVREFKHSPANQDNKNDEGYDPEINDIKRIINLEEEIEVLEVELGLEMDPSEFHRKQIRLDIKEGQLEVMKNASRF